MADIDYKQLAQALLKESGAGVSMKDVPSSTPTVYWGHGNGGLFSYPGLSKPLFSAMILPKVGLMSRLAVRPNNETNPLYGIITGVTATSGDEPVGVCDDPPTAGLTKLCMHSFVFGRYSRMTRVFDLDRAGQITNRGEFTDFQIFGNPFGGAGENAFVPGLPGVADASKAAQNEIAKALFEFGVAWSRDFATQLYVGNPANNTAGGGYKEFYGLDILINTGYRDAETGQLCPAADSIIRDFNGRTVENDGDDLVREITNIYRNLKYLATRAALDPVQWVIAMPFEMFYAITEIWPVDYATYRGVAHLPAGVSYNIDSLQVENMRQDMRGDLHNYVGQYLLIDGQKVPVVLDDAITEVQSGASFASHMYFVPMTVLGNTPVTFMEYFNYEAPNGSLAMAASLAPDGFFQTTDGGRFLFHRKPPNNFCVQMLAKTEPRVLLLTPYLAARLEDIVYSPLEHVRDAFPSGGYHLDGGRYDRNGYGPSFYSPNSRGALSYEFPS